MQDIRRYLISIKPNLKVIGFDLDGVLVSLRYDKYVWNSLLPRKHAKLRNISLRKAKQEVFNAYKEAVGINEWTSLEYWFRKFGVKEKPREVLKEAKSKLYIYKDIEIIKELKKKYNLIILTQSPDVFIEIKTKSFKKYFNNICSSPDTYGSLRKEIKVYREILRKHNIKANEMLYIGDNLEFDYKVPNSIGINTIYVNRKKGHIKGVREIKTLKQLGYLM